MKKLLLLAFVALGMVAMTSCTKENSELIIGKWNMDAKASYEKTQFGNMTETYILADEGLLSSSMTFNENGTVSITTQYAGEGAFTETTAYAVDGDKLIMDGEACTILTLDKKKLIIEAVDTETDDGEQFTYTYHIEMDKVK